MVTAGTDCEALPGLSSRVQSLPNESHKRVSGKVVRVFESLCVPIINVELPVHVHSRRQGS